MTLSGYFMSNLVFVPALKTQRVGFLKVYAYMI